MIHIRMVLDAGRNVAQGFIFAWRLSRTDQIGINALYCPELLVRAALNDLPAIEDYDFIAIADRAQAMRHNQTCAASPFDIFIDVVLRDGVQRGGRFIQDENRRMQGERPGNFQTLTLAGAKIGAVFGDCTAIALSSRQNVVVDARVLRRLNHGIFGRRIVPERQVVAHRPFEQ